MIRLAQLAICLSALLLSGGHWMVLQGVAWSGMMVSYSIESGSVLEGARKTFSGSEPCSLCVRISQAQQTEQEQSPAVLPDRTKETFLGPKTTALPMRNFQRFQFPQERHLGPVDWVSSPPRPIPIA